LLDNLNALNFRTVSNYIKYVSGPLGIAAKVRVGTGWSLSMIARTTCGITRRWFANLWLKLSLI